MNALEDHRDTAAEEVPAEIIARSTPIKKILEQLKTIALSNSTVLMIGETGVGKELFAEYLHKKSVRRFKPLVKISAATLPRELVESELFGHEKGAFTSATSDVCPSESPLSEKEIKG